MLDSTEAKGTNSALSRRKVLRNGVILGAVAAGGTLAAGALTNAAQASISGPQSGWAWCHLCSGMFYYPQRSASYCPWFQGGSGSGNHQVSSSSNYGLNYNNTPQQSNPQSGWYLCGKCRGLFYQPYIAHSHCPAGGEHVVISGGANYCLYMTDYNGGQDNWRWCGNCEGLWWAGDSSSVCPNGTSPGNRRPHIDSGSGNYYLFYFSTCITC